MINVSHLQSFLLNKRNDFCLAESPKRSSSSSSSSSDVETNVEFVIKPCQFILIENENNNNSNCLVLNVSRFF
jgi:hypothetical protein